MKLKNQAAFYAILAIILVLASTASAKNYHMTLLTVGDNGDQPIGGTADAYLEIKQGSGRIFLDSFPLTKIDTQISTRYANKIACDYLETDCDKYDFFYTIRADSTIVGGPSASGALTILTIAALSNKNINNSTVMTGTINSGGSIGPVGGIISKTRAADKAGFNTILIPEFSIDDEEDEANTTNPIITSIKVTTTNNNSNNTNSQIDITNMTSNRKKTFVNTSINIVKIKNLEEAIPYFIDLKSQSDYKEIALTEEYTRTMKQISESLCSKAENLKARVDLDANETNKTIEFEQKIASALDNKNYYSAASYCFNMGVLLRKINLRQIDAINPDKTQEIRIKALAAATQLDNNLEKIELTTLPELEAYIIVKERALEARQILEQYNENITTDDIAYAIERYYSGVYWSAFFNIPGKKINLDEKYLEEACYKKLSEAEERINYADIYLPNILRASRNDIDEAYSFSSDENYKMCLFKASFAKAEANLLLSSLSVDSEKINDLARSKIDSAKTLIARESQRGFFPLMGYSYYEYAASLNNNGDEVSSLIFSEYALELSNLEIYFPKKSSGLNITINYPLLILISSTLLFGMTLGALIMLNHLKSKTISRKLKRRK